MSAFKFLCPTLAVLAACRNDPPARPRSHHPPRPSPALSRDAATVVPPARATEGDERATAPLPPSPDVPAAAPEDSVRAFRVADSTCVRDPARNALGIGVHGYFGNGRLEIEVRNVRYSCTPPPTYRASLEDGVVHLQVTAADRAALGRCQCRHDQFLQVTGIPQGDYPVVVEEVSPGDAGTVTVLGRGAIVAHVPEASPNAAVSGATNG